MKPVLRILLLVFYVSLCFIAWAQNNRNDTILTLDTVQITSGRIYDLSGGQTIITIDSLTMQQYACRSVADVVATQTMLNIKTYGPGMLSNISFRGNAPQHTGVFWNGISINASNIGMADFSLLPVNFFDKIEFQYGGTSSLLGSGSIGGSFHFWSQPEFTNLGKLQLNLQYGSFSDYSGALKMQWANKNLYSSTSVVYTDALNNFDYVNTAAFGSPVQKLSNAAFTGKGLMQDLSCKVNSRNTLSFAGWMQYSDRQIPGTMTTGLSEARQKDDILRLLAGWDRVTENNKIFVKAALTNENESYSDPLILLNSHINIKNYIFESGVSQKIRKNIKLSFNIHNTLSVADVKAYNAVRQQNRTAIVLSYYHNILPIGLKTQLHIRHEFVPHYKVPLFPSFGSEAKIWRFLYGKLSVSKNFRRPTLNDLYWQPGGNTDLKPEESLNEEAGLIIRLNNNLFKNTEISGTVFHSQIENCIQWVPTAYTYWAPQNLKTVRTQGIECMGHTSIEIGKLAMTFNSGYSFTSASNIKSLTPNDESLNKQLIYLPYDKGFINVSILFKDFMVAYNHQFTGFRFVNINNTDFLPAYDLGSCSANYTMPIGKASLQAMFAVDNLWDRSYQVIAWRPMPGRAFRTGISIKFNNN